MAKKKTETKAEQVTIKKPNLRVAVFNVVGTAPYVQKKFSDEAKAKIRAKQAEGSTAVGKKKRDPKDFESLYDGARHVSTQGWIGIPAPAFRSAMIDACRLVGYQMTKAKLSVFTVADGFDKTEGTPLVRIYGEPHYFESMVRLDTGVPDIAVRPMWNEWSAKVKIRYDADQFSLSDVTNLLMRAGMQVGVGEGRPGSPRSHGMGWGTFDVKGADK